MTSFKISDNVHELRISYDGVKYLNEIVADADFHSQVILAGLYHTGENYTLSDVKQAIKDERLDSSEVKRISDEIVNASNHYNLVVAMMLKENTRKKKTTK